MIDMTREKAVDILEDRICFTAEEFKQAVACAIACTKERISEEEEKASYKRMVKACEDMLAVHRVFSEEYGRNPERVEYFRENLLCTLEEHEKLAKEEMEIQQKLELLALYQRVYGREIREVKKDEAVQ